MFALILIFFLFQPVFGANLNVEKMNALFDQGEMSERKGLRTDAVLVIKNGKTVFEKYARGYNEKKRHIMWSVSKTVMAFLYGVALQEKLISLDDSICKYDVFENKKYCDITLRHLLQWSTGIQWIEEYENSGRPRSASILAMAYGEGRTNQYEFVKKQPLAFSPGEAWRYSSGDSILASGLLAKIFKTNNLSNVFKEKLFDPIGLEHWTWESDPSGTLAGAYYFHSSAKDLARIGELILGNGRWKDRQIISPNFLEFMKHVPKAYVSNRLNANPGYISGAHIWLNTPGDSGEQVPWANAPADTLVASGHWGQVLVIIPSLNTVGVRLGDCRDGSFNQATFAMLVAEVGRLK